MAWSWFSKAAAGVGVAGALLAATELALVALDAEPDQPFFRQATDALGNQWWLSNPHVGDNWFLGHQWEESIKAPRSERFEGVKAPGTLRVFVLGESSAYGTPHNDNAAWPSMLEALLQAALPERRVDLVNCALRASTLSFYPSVMEELNSYEPDLFVVYAGHNEYYGARQPGWLERRRLTRLLRSFLENPGEAGADDRQGIRAEEAIPPDAAADARLAERFAADLDRVIALAGDVPVLVYEQPSNLADFSPVFSDGDPGAKALGAIDQVLARPDQRCGVKLGILEEAVQAYPEHSGLHFALGRCLALEEDREGARAQYELAVQTDALPLRAKPSLHAVIAEAPARNPGSKVVVVDPRAAMLAASKRDALGSEFFHDHVHPTLLGGYLVAREGVVALQASKVFGPGTEALPSYAATLQSVHVTPADEYIALTRMVSFLDLSSIRDSATTPWLREQIDLQREQILSTSEPAVQDVLRAFAAGEPLNVHAALTQYWERTGNKKRALAEARATVAGIPADPRARLHLATSLIHEGAWDEAREQIAVASLYGGDKGQIDGLLRQISPSKP